MAVTLFHKYVIRINNEVTIKNGKKDQPPKSPMQEINAKIRGKMYGRRTVNR